jgi:cell division protein FtsI (penicillin-binding protein 3)
MAQAVHKAYKSDPKKFIAHLDRFNLTRKLDLPIKGEGIPFVPKPGTNHWSLTALPWMAHGYNVSATPLQILAFYNAVANNGVLVKPQFVSEIKAWDKTIKNFEPEVLNPKICSQETLNKVRVVLENVVKRGTGKKHFSNVISMAGKTGTTQVNYRKDANTKMTYTASFVGYFPAHNPKYSCIVVVNNPDASIGYYGAEVAMPVFKKIAEKIQSDAPASSEIRNLNKRNPKQEKNYNRYYALAEIKSNKIPDLRGMAGMDAVALLENLKLKVRVVGNGKVKKQSMSPGASYTENQIITLELS